MYKIFVLVLIFGLVSCTGSQNENITGGSTNLKDTDLNSLAGQKFVANNCVAEDFSQGQDDNVYGLSCIEGKEILIKTSKSGPIVKTSTVSDSGNLKIGSDVDFMNKYYNLDYTVLRKKGDDKEIPFLLSLFPVSQDFTGNKDTEYKIVFKTQGDHLVLFKGSKKLQDIPFTERTSLKVLQSRSGKMKTYGCEQENANQGECIDKSDIKKGDYYMVPFIGYPIQYCSPETILNVNNEKTRKSRLKCTGSHLQEGDYIKLSLNSKVYNYNKDLKVNFLPADYFKGNWYFSIGMVEGPSDSGERSISNASLIKARFQPNQILLINDSGTDNLAEQDKEVLFRLPVNWLEFEPAQNGQGQWGQFGERKEKNSDDEVKSTHLSVKLNDIKTIATPLSEINFKWPKGLEIVSDLAELEDLKVEKDYLSFSYKATLNLNQYPAAKDLLHGKQAKWVISLLRVDSKAVDTAGFISRRFFLKDFRESRVFGVFAVFSQKASKVGESNEEEIYDHARMKRFNLLLTEAQKKADRPDKPFKILKWYFSTNSTKDPEYRAVAKRAVEIYDRAFKYISQGKIGVELVEEEKDLGDLRYNLINLVEKDSNIKTGLLGWGPSYANPDTGQIIGSAANIFITPEQDRWFTVVKRYLQYELFERDQNTEEENKIHVISSYTTSLIEDNCSKGKVEEGNIIQFLIDNKVKVKEGTLERNDLLGNREGILACSKKLLTGHSLLNIILHEMGHNFGLTHNFKASADKENYYQDPAEIKKIFGDDFKFNEEVLAKSSSVMDYLDTRVYPAMEYLGYYDLGALRYLYLDELEGKEGNTIDLNINPDLEMQSPLTQKELENRKDYLHCSDEFNLEELFCQFYDYGATPKEIVENNFLQGKRLFNVLRYRYDDGISWKDPNTGLDKPRDLTVGFMTIGIFRSNLYHEKMSKLQSDYLERRGFDPVYRLGDQISIDKYKTIIEEGKNPASPHYAGDEYSLYYSIREEVFKNTMEVLDYDEMVCHVREKTTGKKSQLALEDIKIFFQSDENREVRNCESFLDVFENEGLSFEYQTGFENFTSYYPFHSNISINRTSVSPIQIVFTQYSPVTSFIINGTMNPILIPMFYKSPSLLSEFHSRTEKGISWEENQTSVGVTKSDILLSSYKSILDFVSINGTEEDEEIKRELIDYSFGFRRYYVESGHNLSFDKLVEKPLSSKQNIDNPFLEEAYKDYLKRTPVEYSSFQTYLRTQKKHEIIITKAIYGNKKIIITPYQKDSFAHQTIKEYHDKVSLNKELNLNKLNERIGRAKQPSLVDRVNKIALERYTNALIKRIKTEAR